MGSIYSVQQWASNFNYKVNDIMQNGAFYYYARIDHNSGPVLDLSLWNGTGTDFNGETKPYFFWTPSYNSPVKDIPRIKKIVFGNGYTQRIPDGLYNKLISINVIFDLRSNQEATAIAHFLDIRGGVESFLFTPPQPFNKQKRFVCENFTPNYIFYNNNSISAEFTEVPI